MFFEQGRGTAGLWVSFAALVLVGVLALGAAYSFDLQWGDYGTGDFIAYWSVPRAVLLGYGFYDMAWLREMQVALGYDRLYFGENYYPVLLLWNPPPLVLLLLPLAGLPFSLAALVWAALSALAVGLAAVCFNRQLPRPLPEPVALALPFLILPCFATLYWGQFSAILASLLIFAWIAQRRGHSAVAGCLMVPLLVKPHLLFLAITLLFVVAWNKRQWPTFLAFGGALTLLAGGAFLLDPRWLSDWTSQGTPATWQTLALFDVVKTGFKLPDWARYAGIPLGLALILWRYRGVRELPPPYLGQATLLSILFSPYHWNHDLMVLLPAALWVASVCWHGRVRRMLLLGQGTLNVGLLSPRQDLLDYLGFLIMFLILWSEATSWGTGGAGRLRQVALSTGARDV